MNRTSPDRAPPLPDIVIANDGTAQAIHNDDVAEILRGLGQLCIQRASHVEPTTNGYWLADMSPVQGPMLGPFRTRREALEAESRWLRRK